MKTSLYSILCIAIRLGAVWLGVNVILTVPGAYAAAARGNFGSGSFTILWIWSPLALLVALSLWVYPGGLASLAAGKASKQIFESPLSGREMQHIALVVLGMWFVMSGVIGMMFHLFQLMIVDQFEAVANQSRREKWLLLATPILQIVTGCLLTLGSKGLVGVVHRIRETSLPPAVSDDDNAIEGSDKP